MKHIDIIASLLRSKFVMSGMRVGYDTPDSQPTVNRRSRLTSQQRHASVTSARVAQDWLKYAAMAVMLFTIGVGNVWGAENDTHDFSQSLSQLLNNNASISSINIDAPSYPIKEVIISFRYNKTIENAVTMTVSVGGTSWGSKYSAGTGNNYADSSFTHASASGAIAISFTNNTGSGTGHGTFYINNVRLVEGTSAPAVAHTVTYNAGTGSCKASEKEASAGAGVILPTPTMSCDGWSFAGWTTGALVTSETSVTPDPLYTGGSTYKPAADITLYAVYQKGDGKYHLVTTLPTGDDIPGNYMVVNTSSAKAMDAYVVSNYYLDADATGTITSNAITPANVSYFSYNHWKVTYESSKWIFYNESQKKYLYNYNSTYKNLGLTDSKPSGYTITLENGFAVFASADISGANVYYDSSNSRFAGNNSSTKNIHLYKEDPLTYYSNPSCCTALGQVSGTLDASTPTSATLTWSPVTGAEKYQVKVVGSSSHNDWTDAVSGVTVTGLTCGTSYTAYLRAIDTNGSHCSTGPESTVSIPASSWTVTSTGVTNVTPASAFPTTTCNGFSIASMTADDGYLLPSSIEVTNADHTWNSSIGALTISNVTGNVSITIEGEVAANFTNGATVFIQAESSSAWDASACVKAWFNASGSGGAAQTTYWLFDATGDDSGKKLFATVVPASGDLNQVTLQRFASNCSDFYNNNGTLAKASAGGSNTFRTTGSGNSNVAWNGSGVTIALHGDPSGDDWASSLASFSDQGAGVWTATYENYAPANAAGESQNFKAKTNYNGWIGNTNSNSNATLSGMHVGSTYNITATLDVTDHSLVMSKTFVKGTVSFDLQGHGSAIDALTNVTANSKISAPTAPSETGWDFGGWYKEPACTNAWTFASDQVTETMTLYAKWTKHNYTITSTLSNVSSSPTIPSSYEYTGSAASLSYTISPSSGYRLPTTITVSGTTYTWNSSTGALALTGTITSDVTITITAVQTHIVTWLSNGSNHVSPVTYDHGVALAFPATDPSAPSSCSDKVFVGWTSDDEITAETSTRPTIISAGGAVNADATYRAVFATASGSEGYALVTDATSLNAGDKILIASGASASSSVYVLGYQKVDGSDVKTNRFGLGSVAIDENGIMNPSIASSNSDVDKAFEIELKGSSSGWYLYDGANSGYLQANGGTSKNYLSYNTSDSRGNDDTWTIEINSTTYVATIQTLAGTSYSNRGWMRFNTNLFSCYNSGQSDIYIFAPNNSYSDYITTCCALKPVTNLAVSGTTANSATLTWTAPSPTTGIDHLELRNASTDAKIGSNITNLETTTITINDLTECTSYSYKIVSVGATCETPSETVTARPYSGSKTVNYKYHDGSTADSQFTTDCDNQTITLPTPVWALHTFQGWYTAETGGTKVGNGGATYNPETSPVTVHAQWTETNYTLTQNVGSHTTKGHSGTTIKTSDIASSDLELTYSISDNSYALPKTVTISGGGIATWTSGTHYTWALGTDKHSATLTIKSGLTISDDVSITVTEQARYTITWNQHGGLTYSYYAADDNSLTWGDIDGCGEKDFYGWTTNSSFVSHATTPPDIVSKGSTVSANATYYAIYADADVPANPGYVKITSGITAGTYIIATDKGSSDYAYQAVTSHVSATVSSGVISSLPTGATEVLVELGTGLNAGYFAISYDDNGIQKWIYGGDGTLNSSGLSASYDWSLDTGEKVGEIKSQYTKNSDKYWLQSNSANGDFKAYKGTQTEAYMYKKQTTTWSNFVKTCTLYNISITTPSGGTVTTTPTAGEDAAGEGQTITVNVTPGDCKYLSALKYNDGSDHTISIASTPYTFTMPASDVTVTATFEDKTVSSITVNTSTHRTLMEGTSFVGEQIRVTYNNGEMEDLAWNNASLTFSGYNMSTLGEQTVSVAYSGSCGNANTSYSIEITDGIPVTFSDCGNTTVRKYDPEDVVPVETIDGEYPCVGWQFVGWSSSSVADNSTSFTPVTNFTASEARTLYAVYADTTDVWLSALDATEIRSGATYVIIGEYGGNEKNYALTTLDTLTNYLRRHYLSTPCEQVREPGTYKDRFKMKVNVPPSLKWFIYKDGDYWKIKNKGNNKYLKITTTALSMTNTAEDEFAFGDNDNDESKVSIQSHNSSYYLCYYNSGKYWNAHTSGYSYFCTNMQSFTSNPPCAPRSVTFHGNGGTVTAYGGGSSGGTLVVTEATRDAGINLPTASIDAEDCEGNEWNFFGWIDHPVDVTRVPILTTDMLFDGYDEENPNPHYDIIGDDDEYWAVYANTGEPETKYGTISFTMSDFNQSYSSTENTTTKTVTSMGDYAFGYVNIGHASNTGIQFEEDLGEFYNKTSLGKVNSISFTTFNSGDINMLKVYVGNEEKTTDHQLTAGEMQNVGSTWTYFPTENESYFYITNVGKGNHSFVRVSGIAVDFGQGTTVYATTPVCSTISLSGDVYVTSRNGVGIMAVTPLSVEAHQLAANADVVITSNSSDVYFSTDRTPNFSKASKPTASVTVRANDSGELEAAPIYVHYKPSSTGTGAASDVTVYANLSPANPNIKGEHTIHVRNLPETVVIAAKVGTAWYALNGNMSTACNPKAVQIEVDESTWTAYAADTFAYKLWPVKTTNGGDDRYQTQGEKLRFSAVNHKTAANAGLWANDNSSTNTIKDNAVIDELSDGSDHTQYEWKITTTATGTTWKYTLQMDQGEDHNNNKLNLHRGTNLVWGTYSDGSAVTSDIYLLKFSEIKPFEFDVVEWYPTKMLIQTNNTVNTSVFKAYVDGTEVTLPAAACASKGSKLYEVTNLPLTTANATKSLKLKYTDTPNDYVGITNIPIIISQGTKNVGEAPFTTLTSDVYKNADLVVRDGAVLTLNGTEAANTFNDVTIHPTAKISVPSSKTMKVNKLTFFGGIDEVYDGSSYTTHKYDVPELSLKGKLKKTVSAIDYVMRVDQSQMYSLAVPYDVTLSNIKYWDGTSMGTLGDNLWISAYDGQARANKDMENTWVYEVDFAPATLQKGVGYTISANMQSGVGNEYAIIRMPMSGLSSGNSEAAKSVSVTAYDNNQSQTVTANHKGWNLVGNPYMASISGSTAGGADDSKIVVGYLNENAGIYEWVEDTYRYVTIPDNDGKGYTQTKWSDATLPPFKNFFIQVGTTGDLSFALGSRADAPARNVQAQKREVEFEVLLAGDERQDHTGLLIGERYTPEYEINADLEKMENKLSVYTLTGGYKLAYNALSEEDAKQPIPVGYIADAAGTYTFMLDESGSLETIDHVWLTDFDLNRVTDLMDFPYAFTTIKGRNETRFALSIELTERVDVVTDTGGSVIDEGNTPPMKFIYDDKLYILNHGILYDATGKRVNCINK